MPEKSIPPITDPMGRAWKQPPVSEILFDDFNDYVMMNESTFHQLADYSFSRPSGVYEGKMWRSQRTKKGIVHNFLHWFDFTPELSRRGEPMCMTRTIEIILI